MAERTVVTLLTERGRKFDETGEAIGSHGRSIVFLPKGVEPGQSVRVELHEIREDGRGRMMYRAVPDGDLAGEIWRDNDDGTATQVLTSTDWLGKTSEVGEVKKRQLATREGMASIRRDQRVVWGSDLASTQVEVTEVRVIPIETEQVWNEQLVWQKSGEREEKDSPISEPVGKVEFTRLQSDSARLNAAYSPDWTIFCRVHYGETWLEENVRWVDLPAFLQAEIEEMFPLCSCGRKRYDAQNPDGYSKCEECRKEEVCARCGQQKKATLVSGRPICNDCQPYEEAEQWIRDEIGDTGIVKIVAEAEKLLAGQAVPQELGERLLAATFEQAGWERTQTIEKWNGYHWYHFAEDGVWGSKLAPGAIELLSHLGDASGNGLVELVAWIAQRCGKPLNPDYYLWTQVEGKSGFKVAQFDDMTEKDLCQYVQELANRIQAGQPVLGVWLRESETARLAKFEHARLVAAHLAKHYSNCPICDHSISQSESCVCVDADELTAGFEWEYDENGWEKSQVLRQTTHSGQEIARIEAIPGRRRNSSIVQVVVDQQPSQISDASQLMVTDFNWRVDEAERARRERAKRERQWQEEWAASCQQVESGQFLELSFRKGQFRRKDKETGAVEVEDQWEAKHGNVKYIVDRWCQHQPQEGLVYFCGLGKQLVNSGQFELWTVHIVPPYPEEVPEDWSASEEEVEAKPEVQPNEGGVSADALEALRAKFNSDR